MTSLFEPIAAGIAVAIFNKYILNKLDPLGWCYVYCCEKEEEECMSSSSTTVTSDACRVHQILELISLVTRTYLKGRQVYHLKIQ